jgi:hypothetical protein
MENSWIVGRPTAKKECYKIRTKLLFAMLYLFAYKHTLLKRYKFLCQKK